MLKSFDLCQSPYLFYDNIFIRVLRYVHVHGLYVTESPLYTLFRVEIKTELYISFHYCIKLQ